MNKIFSDSGVEIWGWKCGESIYHLTVRGWNCSQLAIRNRSCGVLIQFSCALSAYTRISKMEKVFTLYNWYEMNHWKKYLSDITKVTLLQVTLLDGLKSVLENIKKNHSQVRVKCDMLIKFWCLKCFIERYIGVFSLNILLGIPKRITAGGGGWKFP